MPSYDEIEKYAHNLYSSQIVTLDEYNNDISRYVEELMELSSENNWIDGWDAASINYLRSRLALLAADELKDEKNDHTT